jgi:hypothetical protein
MTLDMMMEQQHLSSSTKSLLAAIKIDPNLR